MSNNRRRAVIGTIAGIVGIISTIYSVFEFGFYAFEAAQPLPTQVYNPFPDPAEDACALVPIEIGGRVVNPFSRPIPNATIRVQAFEGDLFEAISDQEGVFALDNVMAYDCVPFALGISAEGFRSWAYVHGPPDDEWRAENDLSNLELQLAAGG